MRTDVHSPLETLIRDGLAALGVNHHTSPGLDADTVASEAIERFAVGILAAMGLREVSEDLDLNGVALLGAASVAGLKAIELVEPGLHRLEDAIYALEDLLRRTAPVEA